MISSVNGKKTVTYVQPLPITEGDQGAPADKSRFGGLEAYVYRLPGNLGSLDNVGQTDAVVVLTGSMDDGTGVRERSFQIPFDQFEQYSRARGIELDSIGLTLPGDRTAEVRVAFAEPDMDKGSSQKWLNMFNPNSQDSIFRETNVDPTSDNFGKLIVGGAGSKGVAGIIAEATKIAINKGKETFDLEDVQEAGIKLLVGDTSGILSQTTIRQSAMQNPNVIANIQRNFGDIKPAQPKPEGVSITGQKVYAQGGVDAGTPGATGMPTSPYLRTQADTSISPFLASAFRNKPEMAQNKPEPIRQRELPQIKPIGAGGKLTAATIKTVTPKTVTVKPTAAAVTGTATATQGISGTGYGTRGRIQS